MNEPMRKQADSCDRAIAVRTAPPRSTPVMPPNTSFTSERAETRTAVGVWSVAVLGTVTHAPEPSVRTNSHVTSSLPNGPPSAFSLRATLRRTSASMAALS